MFRVRIVQQPDFKKIQEKVVSKLPELTIEAAEQILEAIKEASPVVTGRLRNSHRLMVRSSRGLTQTEIVSDSPYIDYVLARNDYVTEGVLSGMNRMRDSIRNHRMVE